MNKLPEKLIIEIISYVNPADLIALSSTSKLFSIIVNNNCNKLTAIFDRYTQNFDWIGSRKYKKIAISSQGLEKFFEIGGKVAFKEIEDIKYDQANAGKFDQTPRTSKVPESTRVITKTFGDFIETLSISKLEISLEDLAKTLNLCINLKNFSIEVSKITNCDEKVTNLPTLKLNKLSISQDEENEIQVLKLFNNSEVIELTLFTDIEVKQEEVHEIIKFLQSRTSLETLKIYFEKFEFPIIFENVLFPLKKLSIAKSAYDCSENAETFLTLFGDSLEFSEIDDFGDKIAGILTSFPYLRKLSLNLDRKLSPIGYRVIPGYDFRYCRHFMDVERQPIRYFNALYQVEVLKITNFCSTIIPFFPNLKILKIEKNVCYVNFEYFTELVSLDISICQRCRQIKIPKSLKKLKISIVESEDVKHESPPFCFNETMLEELALEGFKNLSWIENLLNNEKLDLKILKIYESEIDMINMKFLKNFEQKINKINMIIMG